MGKPPRRVRWSTHNGSRAHIDTAERARERALRGGDRPRRRLLAVNLAARLLDAAGADQLVATRPVVESTVDSYASEPIGVRKMRGVAQPVEVFRLR
jgi:hypothetical protein